MDTLMHRRRRRPAPQSLPDDLYDYGHDPVSRSIRQRRNSTVDTAKERPPVIDDWPEEVPVTEVEIDIFARYFGDVLDKLFESTKPGNSDLHSLTPDDNNKS